MGEHYWTNEYKPNAKERPRFRQKELKTKDLRSIESLWCRNLGGGWGPGSRARRRVSERDPRLHPKDFCNNTDLTDHILTEFPILKLDRPKSVALLRQEEHEKHKAK